MAQLGPDDYPYVARQADIDSVEGQRRAVRWVRVELLSLVAVAIAGEVVAAHKGAARGVGIASAALLMMAFAVRPVRRLLKRDKLWFEGRAVAESIRTMTWRYVTHVPPFHDHNADHELRTRVSKILSLVSLGPRWDSDRADARDPTDTMRKLRDRPWEERRQVFLRDRLEDQIDWYSRKSRFNARRATMFLALTGCAQALAVGSAFLLAFGHVNWIGVFATLAAVLAAWTEFKRFQDLELTYGLARDELKHIRDEVRSATTAAQFIDAVKEGEHAISREHTIWAAKSDATLPKIVEVPADRDG